MTKKTILGAVAVAALSVSAGYFLGSDSGATKRADTETRDQSAAIAKLRAENDHLRQRLHQTSLDRSAAGHTASAGRAAKGLGETVDDEVDTAPDPASKAGDIDWSSFSKSLAENRGALERMGGDTKPDAGDHANAMKVIVEWSDVVRQARELSDRPFFDDKIATGFVDAIFSRTLALDAQQRRLVRDATTAALRNARKRYNLDASSALPSFGARNSVIADILSGVKGVLTPAQTASFEAMERTARHMLESDREVTVIGMNPASDVASLEKEILNVWKTAYDLTETELELAQPAARDYIARAEAILREYDLYEKDAKAVDDATDFAIDEALLTVQIEMEDRFLATISTERRAKFRDRMPRVIRMRYGNGVEVSVKKGPGF